MVEALVLTAEAGLEFNTEVDTSVLSLPRAHAQGVVIEFVFHSVAKLHTK